ncbi:LruC domain-containing protein [Granulosicoccus sp.]|nr:LruC domain-containing protein [Granulosicoccus sp.]MDB4224627.1 LruC domain-containing protein [Granulosicoccus sp.]
MRQVLFACFFLSPKSSVRMVPADLSKYKVTSSRVDVNAKNWAFEFSAIILLLACVVFTQSASSQELLAPTAFTECPAKAFLTQGKQPSTYAVNLVTGDYNVVALSHGTSSPLNAVGFNTHDNFFYGWSREHNQPARIHNDWQIEPLSDVNITTATFYVGDVSLAQNKYYVYRRGSAYGLYSVGLDPAAADFLKMIKIIDGSQLFLRIYDMAFHPSDGYAYAVDSVGVLYQIDVSDGSFKNLGSVGEKGVFGATYFDLNGNLYLGRNNDGAIYRIAVNSGDYQAELFTMGPAAGTNDGSRCALAPLSDGTDLLVDFGDAPDSYGTSLNNNGARHGLSDNPTLFLGATVDGESDSAFYPLSDDNNNNNNKNNKSKKIDDEDGIYFVTNIVEGETAVALITASAPGFLSAWIDFNRNGVFDDFEQIITNHVTSAGETPFYINVPTGVSAGKSWARFRISSSSGLPATGGTPDGEVEDLEVKIEQSKVIATSYPSPKEWTTIAFEDNWPFFGDYDMNDLVFYLRNTVYSSDLGISRVVIEGELAAAGASYHNGFAIRLPGVLRSEVDIDNLEFSINGFPVTVTSPLEEDREEAILIVANDIYDFISPGEECTYYRTEPGCGSAIEMSFLIDIPMKSHTQATLKGIFDPFLFATPGLWHGPQFCAPPGRGYEIHLKNQAPTEAFNENLFSGIGQDASSASNGFYFQSSGGLPWAIEVGQRWNYPLEFSEITNAYPLFKNFVDTNGEEDTYWYDIEAADTTHVFTD